MLSILISWVVLGAAFLLTAELLPGFQLTGGWRGAAVVSAIFGIINWLIGWLLFVVLGIVSLGIGFLLANAFLAALYWLLASWRWLPFDDVAAISWLGMFSVATILAVGMSWTRWRRASIRDAP